jgi:mRNA-degrading endonuclease RelE of RelBE toxin-antitoxin system
MQIEFTVEALEDLRAFRRFDQEQVMAGIEAHLVHQATEPSRKRLRPNRLSEWELRVGDFRVFYNVGDDGAVVRIEAIGQKRGNKLWLHGEEYEL